MSVTATSPQLVGLPASVNTQDVSLAVLNAAADKGLNVSATKDPVVTQNLQKAFEAVGYSPADAGTEAAQFAKDMDSLFNDPANTAALHDISNDYRLLGASPADANKDATATLESLQTG